MTRINVIDPKYLSRPELLAEWRELPRVFALALALSVRERGSGVTEDTPSMYTMGRGHVTFFYRRLGFIAARVEVLATEMRRRGYVPNSKLCAPPAFAAAIPPLFWGAYTPTYAALALNVDRINANRAARGAEPLPPAAHPATFIELSRTALGLRRAPPNLEPHRASLQP